jgi:PAS domain S-box-containing protein
MPSERHNPLKARLTGGKVEQHDKSKSFSTETRYRLLVEAVTDYAIYMLDPDGFVVSWNAGAQRLKGYTEAEVLGLHFSQFYPPKDMQAGMPARTLATAEREGRFEGEGWRVAKDGRRFWAHVIVDPIRASNGQLLGYAKVTRDLTERRFAQESLRRSEEQFRLLVQGVVDYAIYMLDPNGIVSSWNAGAQRIKGYQAEEVIGTHFSRFYRPQDSQKGDPQTALATAAREGRFESEGWRVRKDGTEFWANVVIDPIRGGDGSIIGYAKVTRDVTEKRLASEALHHAREALFQSQKLDAIGQLTGGVAHDFNNLLMVVLSSLELARRRLPDDEKLKSLIENAVKGAKRGVSLTQRMLAFARRQELNPVCVDVAELVHGMSDMLERTLGPAIQIDTDFPVGLQAVLIDANQLELAILNLAVNARDAMPAGGRVTIAAGVQTLSSPDDKLQSGEYVVLSITDCGTGMDEVTLARATEPFFTTKGTGKGTGLGLPMVHGLAAQSGGRFVLTSTEGAGTRGEIWLPVVTSRPPASDAISRDLARPQTASHSLVVVAVDDDSLVLVGTVAMLEELGHTVLSAASATEASELIRNDKRVGLLITDQVMPGMSGVELIAALRSERAQLPAILATGYGELATTLDSLTHRLTKPFNQGELSKAISAAVSSQPSSTA